MFKNNRAVYEFYVIFYVLWLNCWLVGMFWMFPGGVRSDDAGGVDKCQYNNVAQNIVV